MKELFLISISLFLISAASVGDERTPVMFKDLTSGIDVSNARPWQPPAYENQKAIGYQIGTFAVPAGMEERVSFWLDIYTKYTTDQGVLHDSRYVNAVYEVVDFTDIMKDESLTRIQQQRARKKRVNQAKERIRQRLNRLNRHTSSAGLEGEDLRYWTMFKDVTEKQKFLKARKKGRLRFQLGQKDRFVKGIYYSGRYIKQMEQIFRDYDLPIELTRIPFVESSFNVNARSSVGASGIWQFMRRTARPYMKMGPSVDERNDPIKSTESSAKLLLQYYKVLGDWPLAVTGYNHGAYGVRRLVRKYQTNNLVEILNVRRGSFGFASANFYASFLAALEAEKNADKYYGQRIVWDAEIMAKQIKLTKNIKKKTLLNIFAGDQDKAKKFNSHLRRDFWRDRVRVETGTFIWVPESRYEFAMSEISQQKVANLYLGNVYRVRSGDTLSEIAENHGVRLRRLLDANTALNPRRLRVGQKIFIPR